MTPRYPLDVDLAVQAVLGLLSVAAWVVLFVRKEQAVRACQRVKVIWLERRGAVGRARVRFEQWVCGLTSGHHTMLSRDNGRVSLECGVCGYTSPGWDCTSAPLKYEQPSAAAVLLRNEKGWR